MGRPGPAAGRSRGAAIAALGLSVLGGGCRSDLLAERGDLAAPGDLAEPPAAPDAAMDCALLGECACFRASGCRVLAEACWCASDRCPDGPECVCGGGAYRGCVAARCPNPPCGPAHALEPTGDGCVRCGGALQCEEAVAQLRRVCGTAPEMIGRLDCGRSRDCVTACLAAVDVCRDVGCGLCEQCGCPRPGKLEECVFGCWDPPDLG